MYECEALPIRWTVPTLGRRNIVASISRPGDCYDNAVAEGFFATLKAEHVERGDFPCHRVAHASVADYIERFYNPVRRHSSLGYISPVELVLRLRVAAFAA